MPTWLKGFFTWLKGFFASDSPNSFARGATVLTIATGVWSLVYLVLKNHELPDPLRIAALGAWMIGPYAIGKTGESFGHQPEMRP